MDFCFSNQLRMAFSMVFRIRTDGGGQANFNKFGVFIFFQHDSGWGGQAEKEWMDGWAGRHLFFWISTIWIWVGKGAFIKINFYEKSLIWVEV